MKRKLLLQGFIKYLLGFIIVGILVFLPAGTLSYMNGWLFMAVLFVPMFVIGIVLMIFNPELLKKRLNAKEPDKNQGTIVKISGIMFILGFIVAGLNEKFQWTNLPSYICYIASIIFVIAYILYFEVLRENTYLSRTIEIQKNQKVIDTGLYGIIRHPMYFTTIIMFMMIPLILNSIFSFIIFLIYPIIIIKRIRLEEKVLEKDLKGYKEYKQKVKYRLFPGIW